MPANATHWSTRTMAAAVGVSEATVRRIWHKHGLKPHLMETFKVSTDPNFAEKLDAIVGLYLNPPEPFAAAFFAMSSSCSPPSKLMSIGTTRRRRFIWTASAADILEKAKRARKSLVTVQSV